MRGEGGWHPARTSHPRRDKSIDRIPCSIDTLTHMKKLEGKKGACRSVQLAIRLADLPADDEALKERVRKGSNRHVQIAFLAFNNNSKKIKSVM